MSQRKVSLALDEYYHIYNRGNSKQTIFKDNNDYQRFLSLLYLANGSRSFEFREIQHNQVFDFDREETLVHIGAYCLMSNHFHILLTPRVEHGIQTFMQKLSTGYSMYFNKKYERTGGLFEGRFKSEHADSDEYLKYLFSYIHLNPVKLLQSNWKEVGILNPQGAIEYLENYHFSSFFDYNGTVRKEGRIITKQLLQQYLTTPALFQKEIKEWITFTLNKK